MEVQSMRVAQVVPTNDITFLEMGVQPQSTQVIEKRLS